jgi:hypothetical protein
MSDQGDLTLLVPGTFQRNHDQQRSDEIRGHVTLNVRQLADMVRAIAQDATAQQMLDLQRMQLARDAWDAMTPEQQRDSAREILRNVGINAVRNMSWADGLKLFATICPTAEIRQLCAPEACEQIVRAAADRIEKETKSSSGWDGREALALAIRAHMASVVAEVARRETLGALTDEEAR